ncbi:MAG: RNA polymerase sigma factor [Solirubrobacteraceae bacterium]
MALLDPSSLPQHVDRLYRAAWALTGSRQDAEDLVQETFALVLARPRRLRDGDELAYLLGALRNTFLTGRRAAARRPTVVASPVEELAIPDRTSTRSPESAYEATEVYAAIAELSEDFRLALVAVDVVGLSYREAGAALHTGEATITTRVYRARQRLAAELGEGKDAVRRPSS